jgi:F0F1-type ATP synthase assembly protein I
MLLVVEISLLLVATVWLHLLQDHQSLGLAVVAGLALMFLPQVAALVVAVLDRLGVRQQVEP